MNSKAGVTELANISQSLNSVAGSAKLGNTVMFLKIAVPLTILFIVVMYIYMKFFYAKRARTAKLSIMIDLEPEIQFFSERVASFVGLYNIAEQDRFVYSTDVTNNLYFYTDISDNQIDKSMTSINKEILLLNNIVFDGAKYDEYEDSVSKFVNTRFRFTKADQFKRDDDNLKNNDRFFDELLTMSQVKDSFNTFLEGRSLTNYLDFDHMSVDDIESNRLFRKFGRVMPEKEGLVAYMEPIMSEMEAKSSDYKQTVGVMRRKIDNNEQFFKTPDDRPTLNKIMLDLLRAVRRVIAAGLFEYNGVTEEDYAQLVGANEDYDFLLTTKDCKEDGDEHEKTFSELTDEERAALVRHMNMIKMIDDLIELLKNHLTEGVLILNTTKEHYIYIEKIVYEEFAAETHEPIFDAYKQIDVVTKYQSVIDYAYMKAYPRGIEDAVKFTVYFMLDRDKRKEEKLERLAGLYVAFNDVFIVQEYRKRLDSYANSRDPDLKKLKKLYLDTLENYYKYYLKENIIDQWMALYSGKRPKRYAWTLDWLRDLIGDKSVDEIVTVVFPEIDDGAGEVVDDVFDGMGDVVKKVQKFHPLYWVSKGIKKIPVLGGIFKTGLGIFKKVAEFGLKVLKMTVKLLAYLIEAITKPKKLLKLITKGLLLIVVLALKFIFYLFKAGDVYLVGEFILYNLVLYFFTIANVFIWGFLTIYTSIIMILDLALFKGWIYRFLYWAFGASENSPRAWYMRSGYHYGSHNRSTRHKNMVKRMILAYKACPDNYKPDPKTFGLMCTRNYRQEPGYCLQANINRVREDMSYSTPHVPGAFLPDMEFFDAKRGKRNRIVNEFKTMKRRFFANCDSAMRDHDPLSKNVCRLYTETTSPSRHRALQSLCYNAYCTNGKNEAFCYKFAGDTLDGNSSQIGGGQNVYKRMSVLTVYIVLLTYIISSMLTRKASMKK